MGTTCSQEKLEQHVEDPDSNSTTLLTKIANKYGHTNILLYNDENCREYNPAWLFSITNNYIEISHKLYPVCYNVELKIVSPSNDEVTTLLKGQTEDGSWYVKVNLTDMKTYVGVEIFITEQDRIYRKLQPFTLIIKI